MVCVRSALRVLLHLIVVCPDSCTAPLVRGSSRFYAKGVRPVTGLQTATRDASSQSHREKNFIMRFLPYVSIWKGFCCGSNRWKGERLWCHPWRPQLQAAVKHDNGRVKILLMLITVNRLEMIRIIILTIMIIRMMLMMMVTELKVKVWST